MMNPIHVYEVPQSNGEVLYGARIGGYVVANGYKSRDEALNDALEKRAKMESETIVLEEVLNEDKLADYGDQVAAGTMTEDEAKKLCMVWEWSVPSLGLGGYCLTREDATSDARLCIGMQCPKIP
jgi:hypothetical protein